MHQNKVHMITSRSCLLPNAIEYFLPYMLIDFGWAWVKQYNDYKAELDNVVRGVPGTKIFNYFSEKTMLK